MKPRAAKTSAASSGVNGHLPEILNSSGEIGLQSPHRKITNIPP